MTRSPGRTLERARGRLGDWGERARGELRRKGEATPKTMPRIRSCRDLDVYQTAMDAAMRVFVLTKNFPIEERFSMVDQVRRSSRSVCANIAEAWRKRRYKAHFASKLSDAETEAEETRVWLELAHRCQYLADREFGEIDDRYDKIIGQLVRCAIAAVAELPLAALAPSPYGPTRPGRSLAPVTAPASFSRLIVCRALRPFRSFLAALLLLPAIMMKLRA